MAKNIIMDIIILQLRFLIDGGGIRILAGPCAVEGTRILASPRVGGRGILSGCNGSRGLGVSVGWWAGGGEE